MRKQVVTVALISLALAGCVGAELNLMKMAHSGASDDQIQALLSTPEYQHKIKTNDWSHFTGSPQCLTAQVDQDNRVLALLIKNGADIDHCPYLGGGNTAAMFAAIYGAPENLKLLLNAGTDITLRNNDGKTLLDVIVDTGNPKTLAAYRNFTAMQEAWATTSRENTLAGYREFLKRYPEGNHTAKAKEALAELEQVEKERAAKQAKLEELEAQMPVGVRYDKYMVRLSALLKTQQYEKALPVFAQIEQLNTRRDPSFDYFYGESLLKTGRYEKAVARLYKYIKEQGSGAKHYAESLDLINQAEGKL